MHSRQLWFNTMIRKFNEFVDITEPHFPNRSKDSLRIPIVMYTFLGNEYTWWQLYEDIGIYFFLNIHKTQARTLPTIGDMTIMAQIPRHGGKGHWPRACKSRVQTTHCWHFVDSPNNLHQWTNQILEHSPCLPTFGTKGLSLIFKRRMASFESEIF